MARQRDIIDIEMWRDIPGFDGIYQASSHGRIRRLPRLVPSKAGSFALKDFNILKCRKPSATHGYLEATLVTPAGRQRKRGVHWIICRTFHGSPPSPTHQAAHGDGCKTNNRADNLRWATPKENAADRKRHGNDMEGVKHPSAKLTEAQVHEIRADYRGGYGDLRRLGNKYGVTSNLILNVVKRRTWKHI